MGHLVSLLTANHISTKRDYASRAGDDKYLKAEVAKHFDREFWDGDRTTGYGGYHDDGRWAKISQQFLNQYEIPQGGAVLDIGCGKGYFLNSIKYARPDIQLRGLDISSYAISKAPTEIREFLTEGCASELNYKEKSFDLVVSINTLHNLNLPQLFQALEKIEKIKKTSAYICVEAYRNEKEKWNLMRWQLTCECFFTPEEWEWIFKKAGYSGDYEFIFFE